MDSWDKVKKNPQRTMNSGKIVGRALIEKLGMTSGDRTENKK